MQTQIKEDTGEPSLSDREVISQWIRRKSWPKFHSLGILVLLLFIYIFSLRLQFVDKPAAIMSLYA